MIKSTNIFIEPTINRKRKHLKEHLLSKVNTYGKFPIFSLIEFNIIELCNRKCVFCPRIDEKIYPNRKEFMTIELYEKIMKDLAKIDYSGKILFSAFSEPLLHKQIN